MLAWVYIAWDTVCVGCVCGECVCVCVCAHQVHTRPFFKWRGKWNPTKFLDQLNIYTTRMHILFIFFVTIVCLLPKLCNSSSAPPSKIWGQGWNYYYATWVMFTSGFLLVVDTKVTRHLRNWIFLGAEISTNHIWKYLPIRRLKFILSFVTHS